MKYLNILAVDLHEELPLSVDLIDRPAGSFTVYVNDLLSSAVCLSAVNLHIFLLSVGGLSTPLLFLFVVCGIRIEAICVCSSCVDEFVCVSVFVVPYSLPELVLISVISYDLLVAVIPKDRGFLGFESVDAFILNSFRCGVD